MEYRLATRFPLKLPIEVWRAGVPAEEYTSLDISHGGVFVSNCNKSFEPGHFVYVKLTTNIEEDPQEYLMKAVAIHSSSNGIGLKWMESSQKFHNELETMR